MKTRYCDTCKNFNDEDMIGVVICFKGHNPRWYKQKSDNPHDIDYGYKRKCHDYDEIKEND